MGSDTGIHPDWDLGDQDWLWQDVTAPPHTAVVFTITEIQHMHGGIAQIRIYGCPTAALNCEGAIWQEIWFRPAPAAPMNTPANRDVWYTYPYTIPANFPQYQLQFYGEMLDEEDGWKFTLLDFRVAN